MDETSKQLHNVRRLVKRCGLPKWRHRFGPKTYTFYEHVQGLLLKDLLNLSFRRASSILRSFGLRCPSKSALHHTTTKVAKLLWDMLLAATRPRNIRKTTKKGHYRKIALKAFRTRTYHRRELAKSLISAIKRTLGGSIRCRRARTIRAEIIRKCIVYNAFLMLYRLLGQSQYHSHTDHNHTDRSHT